ncbi:MAG: undecaprenyl-diphosphate phosphatase [Proteobacteria bacterium]|nr:undecaprenyl-diphosphate phosphatase [Pseudomonadota bacterium]
MPFLQLATLAVIQGITEFLPISSSGHLRLVALLSGWPDQGLMIDVAVHVGTLFAVMTYLWRDIVAMLVGLGRAFQGRFDSGFRLLLQLIVATLPVIAAGYFLDRLAPGLFDKLEIIAWATLIFGIVLWLADRSSMTLRRVEHLAYSDVIIIGLSQVLALIPGTSRSGITMTAARVLDMERRDAARFSMLLSMPTILGAGVLKGWDLYKSGDSLLAIDAVVAAGLSFVVAIITIMVMMAWLRRASFTPFVVYRIVLGGGLLALVYGLI